MSYTRSNVYQKNRKLIYARAKTDYVTLQIMIYGVALSYSLEQIISFAARRHPGAIRWSVSTYLYQLH